jgi:hypothetical protein
MSIDFKVKNFNKVRQLIDKYVDKKKEAGITGLARAGFRIKKISKNKVKLMLGYTPQIFMHRKYNPPDPGKISSTFIDQPNRYGTEELKPYGGLWTSDELTPGESIWLDYIKHAGYRAGIQHVWRLVPKEDARILVLATKEDYQKFVRDYGGDWNKAAEDYDGVHYADLYVMDAWGIPSTMWFNLDVFENIEYLGTREAKDPFLYEPERLVKELKKEHIRKERSQEIKEWVGKVFRDSMRG